MFSFTQEYATKCSSEEDTLTLEKSCSWSFSYLRFNRAIISLQQLIIFRKTFDLDWPKIALEMLPHEGIQAFKTQVIPSVKRHIPEDHPIRILPL